MQLPAENLGQHPAGSEYAINASSGSPHNALNPRRFTPERISLVIGSHACVRSRVER